MAVFAIIAEDDSVPADLSGIIKDRHPDCFQYNKRTWFVSLKGQTVKKVAESIGMKPSEDEAEDELVGVAIFRINPSYWGNATADLWDWLKANFEGG